MSISVFAQDLHNGPYLKYLDSAEIYIDENSKKAAVFLDSIPKPLNQSIKGHLACFYELKVILNDRNHEIAKQYHNTVLALKYAELEKNYNIAGWASLELFYHSLVRKNDSSGYKYLKDAKAYYTLDKNNKGLAEVTLMHAMDELNKQNYVKSNTIIKENLEEFKRIKDDAYYQMYGLFLLTTNYIYLDSLNVAHKCFNSIKNLESNSTLQAATFNRHLVTLNIRFANYHLKKGTTDSTMYYLSKSKRLKSVMSNDDKMDYYNLLVDVYDAQENWDEKRKYVDSLRLLKNDILEKTLDATTTIGDVLLKSELELNQERKKQQTNTIWIAILFILALVLISIYVLKLKKSKKLRVRFNRNKDEFNFLKSNHEKLKVKIHGMEEYLNEVKQDIKTIASIESSSEKQTKIKDLYKKLRLNATIILDKNEDHLNLINELNIDFFTKIKSKYPQISDSEMIICYYLFVGFKNKEIAVFLKTTARSVEGKRYRIRKKLNIQEPNLSLKDFLSEAINE